MVNHRDQARFERAGWRIHFLIASWAAQIAMLLGLIGVFSYRLAGTVRHWQEKDKAGSLPTVELVWECTEVGLSLLALVLNFVEIFKTLSEALTPFLMLFTHVLKLTCASATLALDIVVYIRRSDQNYSIVGLAVDAGLLAVTLATFIYSAIAFRRLHQYQDYHLAVNVKQYGSHGETAEVGSAMQLVTSKLRSSASTVTTAEGDTPDPARASQAGGEPYSHQRDTLYDGYLERHSSVRFKSHVDQALGAEFGWGGSRPSSGRVERSGSVVAAGAVPAPPQQSDAAPRRVSERALVSVPEAGHDGDPGARAASAGGAPTAPPAPREGDEAGWGSGVLYRDGDDPPNHAQKTPNSTS